MQSLGRSGATAPCGAPREGDALPTLGLPVLAGVSGEAVDSAALSFSLARALEEERKAEERTKKLEEPDDEFVMLMVEAHGLLTLGKPAWTAEQRARLRVLSTWITSFGGSFFVHAGEEEEEA